MFSERLVYNMSWWCLDQQPDACEPVLSDEESSTPPPTADTPSNHKRRRVWNDNTQHSPASDAKDDDVVQPLDLNVRVAWNAREQNLSLGASTRVGRAVAEVAWPSAQKNVWSARSNEWQSLHGALDRIQQRQPLARPKNTAPRQTEEVVAWNGTCGNTWSTLAGHMKEAMRRKLAAHADRMRLVSRLSFSIDPMRSSARNTGDERLDRINRDLDLFGAQRTPVQKLMHHHFLQASLEKVYGSEWDSSAIRVLQRFGLTEPCHEVMAMTPRRFGKTWSVAMFVVAMLLNVPGLRICIFSTGSRASASLTKIAMSFVHKIKGADARICKQTNEELFIAQEPLPVGRGVKSLEATKMQTLATTSTLYSYPSSPTGACLCVCVSIRMERGSGCEKKWYQACESASSPELGM
jgi:hypothetical protein